MASKKKQIETITEIINYGLQCPEMRKLLAEEMAAQKFPITVPCVIASLLPYQFRDPQTDKMVEGISLYCVTMSSTEVPDNPDLMRKGINIEKYSLTGSRFFNFGKQIPNVPCLGALQFSIGKKIRLENFVLLDPLPVIKQNEYSDDDDVQDGEGGTK